jgi:hypothetical protein
MKYKATLSRRQKVSTAIVLALIVLANQWMLMNKLIGEETDSVYAIIIIISDFVSLFLFLISPHAYEITGNEIIISRFILKRHIAFSDIDRIEKISSEEIQFSFRTFGVGGFFGSYGQFVNRKSGSMTWFVTQRINFIMLHLKSGEQVVITPDDAGMFEELKKKLLNG